MSGSKSDSMVRALEARIICGSYAPGQKIPSLRQLARKYGLPLNTARRGVEHLVRRGLLEAVHGSGCYVAEHRSSPHGRWRIAVACSPFGLDIVNTCTGLALIGVREEARRQELELESVDITGPEMNDAVFERLSRRHDGVILLGGYDERLCAPHPGAPAVGVSMHRSFHGLFSLLELDPFQMAELAREYFLRRGCRKLTVIPHPRPVHRFREQLFRAEWEGEVETLPHPVPEFTPGRGYLYFCGADALDDAERYFAATGRELADDHVVLAVDGRPVFSEHRSKPLPSITVNWHRAGREAVAELLRRLRSPGTESRRVYFNCELFE